MITTIQGEIIRDLISTNDATIIGILIAFIGLLIYNTVRLDKKVEKSNDYIREQDKANLTMINDLITAVNSIGDTSEKNATRIEGVSDKTSAILTIIKERLTR